MNPFLHLLTLRSAGYNDSSNFLNTDDDDSAASLEKWTMSSGENLTSALMADGDWLTAASSTNQHREGVKDDGLPMAIVIYCIIETILSLHTACANGAVIFVFIRQSRLRTITNTYIFSLAIADCLTGLIFIPMTVFSVLTRHPKQYDLCLLLHSSVMAMCTVSIFHLLAIAIDKYLSICRAQVFKHKERHGRAAFLIMCAWLLGLAIGNSPVLFLRDTADAFSRECHFMLVVDMRFLVYGIFYGTIIIPTIVILLCYLFIYQKINQEGDKLKRNLSAHQQLRRSHSRAKILQSLFSVVITFIVCWYPLYIINTAVFYGVHINGLIILSAVILSHLSAALNPLIYAYGLPAFRLALCGCITKTPPAINTMNGFAHQSTVRRDKMVSSAPDVSGRHAVSMRTTSIPAGKISFTMNARARRGTDFNGNAAMPRIYERAKCEKMNLSPIAIDPRKTSAPHLRSIEYSPSCEDIPSVSSQNPVSTTFSSNCSSTVFLEHFV